MAREVLSFVLDVNTKGVKSGLDKAGKGFVSLGKMARSSLAGIAQGLRSTGAGIQVLDHAMGVFNKLREMSAFFFGTFISASLEMRAETDKQRKDLERMGAELRKLAAAIGDLLIPLILGIGDAFLPAISEAGEFLKANKKQIGSGIVEHFMKLATAISEGIAPALVLASKAFSGLSILVDSLTAAGAKFASAYVGSIAAVLRGVERLNRAMGREGAAKAAADAAKENEELARSYDEVGNIAMGEILKVDEGQKQLEASINGFADALEKRVGQAGVAAMRRYGEAVSTAAAAESEEKQKRRDEERLKRMEVIAERERKFQELSAQRTEEVYARALANEQKLADKKKQTADQQKQANEEIIAQTKEALQSVVEFGRGIFAELDRAFSDVGRLISDEFHVVEMNADGVLEEFTVTTNHRIKTMADAWGDFFKGLGKMILKAAADFAIAKGIEMAAEKLSAAVSIKASAAKAGGQAVAAHAGVPFVGLGLGLAAAAAAIAAIMAFKPFATGGFVTGPAGTDRVPALLTAGEYVLPKNVVDGIRQGTPPRQKGHFADGGMVTTGAGATHIHLPPIETIARPIAADNERYYRQHVVPAVEHLQRVGLLPG